MKPPSWTLSAMAVAGLMACTSGTRSGVRPPDADVRTGIRLLPGVYRFSVSAPDTRIEDGLAVTDSRTVNGTITVDEEGVLAVRGAGGSAVGRPCSVNSAGRLEGADSELVVPCRTVRLTLRQVNGEIVSGTAAIQVGVYAGTRETCVEWVAGPGGRSLICARTESRATIRQEWFGELPLFLERTDGSGRIPRPPLP